MAYLLALDQGTTSSRAIVFDETGNTVGQAQKEFRQYFPANDRVEHDATEIWKTQLAVARDVLDATGTKDSIVGIGITNQRETTVVWDRQTGSPISNAIVWQDRRTANYCKELRDAGMERIIRQKSGLLLDPYFSATKLRWILNNVESARSMAVSGRLAFGTIDTWLLWNLTRGEVHATDATNASRTMLMNLDTLDWDDELLELFDIPKSVLPEIRSSSEIFGYCDRTLFDSPIPISGIAGDQHAALFGQLCIEPGMAKNTYGTGCFVLQNTGTRRVLSENRLLTTLAPVRGGTVQYALEGSVFVGGAVVQWLRDGLGLVEKSSEIESLARSVPDSGGVVFVPAFTGLGAPHWDPFARGTILGLNRGSTRAHLARAALESIALQSMDVLKAMEADSGSSLTELRVDGGASMNNLLMQFQADVSSVPVVRAATTEATALGAAYLAGLAVGTWSSEEELRNLWTSDRTFRPTTDQTNVIKDWTRAVSRAREWAEHEQES